MHDNDPINGYYNLLVAIIVRAIDDYLSVNRKNVKYWKPMLTEDELRNTLKNFFSDEAKVDAIMGRANALLEAGYTSVSEGRYYEKES